MSGNNLVLRRAHPIVPRWHGGHFCPAKVSAAWIIVCFAFCAMSSGSFFLPSFLRFHSRLSSEKARNSMAREMNPGSRKKITGQGNRRETQTHTHKKNKQHRGAKACGQCTMAVPDR